MTALSYILAALVVGAAIVNTWHYDRSALHNDRP